jgi:outer membrane protein, heavy metal efflux system
MYKQRPQRRILIIHFMLLVLVSSSALATEAVGEFQTLSETELQKQQMDLAKRSASENGERPVDNLLALEEAIAVALQDNPGLAQMRARAEAMAAIPSQVGTLPDPRVSINAMNMPTDSFDFSQENMTQRQLGVSQMFPFPGKLALREQAAEYEAAAAVENVDEVRLLLIRDVKTVWWRLFNLDQSLSIVLRNQDLLRQFVQIAETKYSVGQGLQQDVLLAQLELSKLLDLELRLIGARRNENARLNALLDISPDQGVQLPQQIDKHMADLVNEQDLYQRADQSRPLLASQENRIKAANTRVDLAKKDYYPDFNVGATYGYRSGDNPNGVSRSDFASIMFSMNVPLFIERKQSKAVAQRKSEWVEQNYKLHSLRNKIRADISVAVADYLRARDQFDLFGTGIIPQAQQTVSSMLAGYQVNKVDFLNLVRAQITLYNYEISYWRMLSEAKQALAKIIAAVGEETVYE